MSPIPKNPKIFHITHVTNLSGIVSEGLWSDAERMRRGLQCTIVGMSEIKRRRLEELEVGCHPGTRVGQYVPFYFCPRSVMLYLLHMGNHPDLTYRAGQGQIAHIQADLWTVLEWTNDRRKRWAFSKGNAGARYAEFSNDVRQLKDLNWDAIEATDWRDPDIKEGKQAEFLIEGSFPWELAELVGVLDATVSDMAHQEIAKAQHKPAVVIESAWYY